jgi:hypothetical protein
MTTHDTPEAARHPDGCESCARPSTVAGRRVLAQFHGWPDRPEYPWNLLDANDIIEIERQAATAVLPPTHDTPEAVGLRMLRWIVRAANLDAAGSIDHACAECIPGGSIVVPGFRCVPHEARAALEPQP